MGAVAIIPARGGSKRIPRKNIKCFAGKPIIAWSIETALQSGCFDKVVVSSDDPEVIAVAETYGAEAPFVRPAELSNDYCATLPVIRHALEELEKLGYTCELACCLYATAPFVTPPSLMEGYRLLREYAELDFAFAASEFSFPIFRSLKKTEDGRVEMFWPEHELTRSQDLPKAYHDAGQFYWGRREAFMTQERVFASNCRMVELPPYCVQDIDTPSDWRHAELIFKTLNTENELSVELNITAKNL